jgi:hypothetical protein
VIEVGEVYLLNDVKVGDITRANELANRCKYKDPEIDRRWQEQHTNQVLSNYEKSAAAAARYNSR